MRAARALEVISNTLDRMSDQPLTDPDALRMFCASLVREPWLALDTEFMRVQTYRARLCLVQLATPQTLACIDPLALPDLTPLFDLIYAPAIVKVLHAARQDIEVFVQYLVYDEYMPADSPLHRYKTLGLPPRPVFDTQIAAALLGYDDQIGYGALVEAITGHKLAKLEARTDWAARPLAAAQIRYAADDVHYLRDVYLHLDARLRELGRAEWHAEECAALTDPQLYRNDPDNAWRRLNAGASLSPPAQTILAALATWREREAQARDLPRGWVVPDQALVEIARHAPASVAALGAVPDMKPGMVRRDGEALLEVVQQAQHAPVEPLWETSERLDPPRAALVKRLADVVQRRAREASVSPTLVAPRRELLRLVRGDPACALLHGWRRAFIGEELVSSLTLQT